MIEALDIHVNGIVQGVGFRPFVYRLAKRYLINGWVLNAQDGVQIHAEGDSKLLDEFVIELSENAPAAAQVKEIELKEVPLQDCKSFEIRFSDSATTQKPTLVSPDMATCDQCLHELFDPTNRRYRYPFINCTDCGPRFTILEKLPYDRPHTSMRDFIMDPLCQAEYDDPSNRRFHAQPNACFDCGPAISFIEAADANKPHDGSAEEFSVDGTIYSRLWGDTQELSDAILSRAVQMLCDGKILAVKGLGGFHLVCDAQNPEAVATLRRRKQREGKPFAVMAASVEDAAKVCFVNEVEELHLRSTQRPIVLLQKRPGVHLVEGLADCLPELGIMLPTTPLQHLLIHDFSLAKAACEQALPSLLVMTSGNIHDEPIVTDDFEACEKLGSIADAIIGNNRAILTRFDDSIIRIIHAGSAGFAQQMIRRARGFAPQPLRFSLAEGKSDKTIFATGPEQKNTFTFLRGAEAYVSQHIGDVERAEIYEAWLATKRRFEELFDLRAQAIACDAHPEYLTSKWAHEQDLPCTEVQHHHAHIASLMAEHDLHDAVCGIAFDGTGYGADGSLWGGEVLIANLKAFERFANFAYVPMPGGAAAIRHPLRMAYGALWAFDLLEHPAAQKALAPLSASVAVFEQMIDQGINTPLTSSVGRLFDAASALLGVCTDPSYEGEAAILLEAAMEGGALEPESAAAEKAMRDDLLAKERYAVAATKNVASPNSTAQDTSVVLLDAAPTFQALLDDLEAGVPIPIIARRFHEAMVSAILMAAELVRAVYDIQIVALSGGVFMNRYLIEHSIQALEQAGFTVVIHRDLPPNDGCISYGQAVVAWAQSFEESES